MMIPAIDKFVDEIRATVGHTCADEVEHGLEAVYDEGATVPDAQELLDGVTWVIKQPRSLNERVEAILKLVSLEGRVRINLPAFLGWK